MGVRHLALAAAVAVLAACDAPTVPTETPAYDPSLPAGAAGLIYHWPLGYTITVYAHSAGAPAGFDLRAAIQRANDIWSDALRYREFDIRFVDSPVNADVVYHFDTDRVVDVTGCVPPPSGAAGVTSICVSDDETTLEPFPLIGGGSSRVTFDVQISTSPIRIPNVATFNRIVAHEFGHVLGIGRHSADNTDLMFGGPTVDLPSADDIRTLRYVLRQPAGLRP